MKKSEYKLIDNVKPITKKIDKVLLNLKIDSPHYGFDVETGPEIVVDSEQDAKQLLKDLKKMKELKKFDLRYSKHGSKWSVYSDPVFESIEKINEQELSKLQVAYREFFKSMMDEFDVTTPIKLSTEDRKKFFNRIKKEWPATKKKITEDILRQIIKKEIVEITKEDHKMKKSDLRQIIKEEIQNLIKESTYYSAEYYDKQGGHGEVGHFSDFSTAYKKAVDLYKREKKGGELGKSIGYIGVAGSDDEFAIMFVDKDYISKAAAGFDDPKNYKIWLKVAKKVLFTGKPMKGKF